jgi:hypothetical protein
MKSSKLHNVRMKCESSDEFVHYDLCLLVSDNSAVDLEH